MEFMSIKDQSKEFINSFCNWWSKNRKDADLVEILLSDKVEVNMYGRIKNCNLYLGREYFPVATEGQLRHFIQDKTKDKYDILYSLKTKKNISFYKYTENEDKATYEADTHDLLKAYWKVAIKVSSNV